MPINKAGSDNINSNKTTKPVYRRPDLAPQYDEMLADSYSPDESSKSDGTDRGLLPTDRYPIGSVPNRKWNQSRPMRRGKSVQQSHKHVSEHTLSCNEKGTMVDGGNSDA